MTILEKKIRIMKHKDNEVTEPVEAPLSLPVKKSPTIKKIIRFVDTVYKRKGPWIPPEQISLPYAAYQSIEEGLADLTKKLTPEQPKRRGKKPLGLTPERQAEIEAERQTFLYRTLRTRVPDRTTRLAFYKVFEIQNSNGSFQLVPDANYDVMFKKPTAEDDAESETVEVTLLKRSPEGRKIQAGMESLPPLCETRSKYNYPTTRQERMRGIDPRERKLPEISQKEAAKKEPNTIANIILTREQQEAIDTELTYVNANGLFPMDLTLTLLHTGLMKYMELSKNKQGNYELQSRKGYVVHRSTVIQKDIDGRRSEVGRRYLVKELHPSTLNLKLP